MISKSGILQFIKERFPIQILAFTTLSTVLASASIATDSIFYWHVIVAFVITTLFLFHIRVIDERRDFVNDTVLHPDRPVQRGIISIKSLLIISIFCLGLSLILAFFSGIPAFVIALLFVVFTTFAAFDFFMPGVFKNRPILYHVINSPQMILLQWLIFSIFTSSFTVTKEMFLFMLLIYNNIFILELARKINAPDHDTRDSYTAHLGLKKSVSFLIFLVLTGFAIYTFILRESGSQPTFAYLFGALLSTCVIGVCLYFYFKPQKAFQKIMELSAVLFYIFMNVLLYIAK